MRYASVCDGIGAVHVAWQPLGWECAWTSEIEPFPAAVVDHHWKLKNLGDMMKLTEEMLNDCGPISLLCGGTPCQSFSVAGLRKGLEDPRGNLALRFTQLVGVLRPEWVVWENVPGVLSSGEGRDFGAFLWALAELGYGFAYRILDAQWFGVAQRRRRVFVVGYLGDWRRAAAVLFERESVFGNPPTRGAKGQGTPFRSESRTSERCDQPYFIDRASFNQGQNAQYEAQIKDDGLALSLVARGPGAVAFTKSKRDQSVTDDESWVPGEVSPTMSCFDQGDTRATTVVAVDGRNQSATNNFHHTLRTDRDAGDCVAIGSDEVAGTLRSNPGSGWRSNGTPVEGVAIQGMAVRRLTPRECERLQGFPDDYTAVTYRKKPAADGPRYRALGNSMAVPVMAWIGQRIAEVEADDGR
jgi:DNA (cytosine-5)-methyltransferase 1